MTSPHTAPEDQLLRDPVCGMTVDAQAGKSPKVTDFKPARTGEATRGTGLES